MQLIALILDNILLRNYFSFREFFIVNMSITLHKWFFYLFLCFVIPAKPIPIDSVIFYNLLF